MPIKMRPSGTYWAKLSWVLMALSKSVLPPSPNEIRLRRRTLKRGLKITYLPQSLTFNPQDTILDHLFRADSPTTKAIRDYQWCLAQLETSSSNDIDKQLSDAMAQMDLLQAWDYEARVTSIL